VDTSGDQKAKSIRQKPVPLNKRAPHTPRDIRKMLEVILKKEVEDTCEFLFRHNEMDKALLVEELYRRWLEAESKELKRLMQKEEFESGI
jgi:hypothetical protein